MRPLILVLFFLASCTVPDKASLKVMNETRKLRKAEITLKAFKQGNLTNDKFQIRNNNSFAYDSYIRGTQKAVYYAGTFTRKDDTLILNFQDNHKDSLWTEKAVIDTAGRIITLMSVNTSYNKEMTITMLK